MTRAQALAREVEPIAARGWPAAERERLGEWRLHASSGYSGRINSCWTLGRPGKPLPQAISSVEAWFERRGLAPLFKVVEGSSGTLSRHLAALGYEGTTTTLVMLGAACGEPDPGVALSDRPDRDFARVFAAAQGPDADDARERLEALGRIRAPRYFAVATAQTPAAIGACAVEGAWAGVLAMRTDLDHRRRGLARRILTTLLAAARRSDARRVYLQVEAENGAAVGLYRGAGFVEAYRYRYWRRAAESARGAS
ncbi:MAG TPA: GNAT family N-acetyltransferase [Caulobacteraceae bacterium]